MEGERGQHVLCGDAAGVESLPSSHWQYLQRVIRILRPCIPTENPSLHRAPGYGMCISFSWQQSYNAANAKRGVGYEGHIAKRFNKPYHPPLLPLNLIIFRPTVVTCNFHRIGNTIGTVPICTDHSCTLKA